MSASKRQSHLLPQCGLTAPHLHHHGVPALQHLKTMGDLGMVVPLGDFDFSEDAIRRAIARSNVVINLTGAHQETWNYSFEDVHVKLAHRCGWWCGVCGMCK